MDKMAEVAKLLSGDTDGDRLQSKDSPKDDDKVDPITDDNTPGAASNDGGAVGDSSTDDNGANPENVRRTVKDLAKDLGITAEQLYETLEIKLPTGESYNLSALKDMAAKGVEADKVVAKYNSDANSLLASRKEIYTLVDLLKAEGKVSDKIVNQARQQIADKDKRETELLSAAIPSWEIKTNRDNDLKAIYGFVSQYGIGSKELDSLVTDHRLVKMIRDVSIKTEENKPKNDILNKPAGRGVVPKVSIKKPVTRQEKLDAVAALIS